MTIFLTWLHLLAAVGWIGGMIFLSLVLAPLVRGRKAAPEFMALFRSAALRFRLVVWSAIAVLLFTGPLLAVSHGWPLFEPNRWPSPLATKLSLVGVLLVMTLAHDLVFGPRVRAILDVSSDKRTSADQAVLAAATWLPRLALVLALAVLLAAVVLARS